MPPHEEDTMAETVQFNLKPDEIPTAWYNILPDMAAKGIPPLPPLHPGTHEPVTPDLLLALFPESLVKQEVSTESWIDIPGPILDIYRLWRPTPLRWEEVPDCDPAALTIDTVPGRFGSRGDPSERMDEAPGSLEPLLDLAAQHEAAGFGDAPWPPHFAKQAGEPPRVQPSKRKAAAEKAREGVVPPPAPGKAAGPTGRRRSTMPLVEIARAATEQEAREGLERWKARHPHVWPYLAPPDVLVDSMRGRSTTWTRIRVNLRNVPEAERPPQEELDVDYDPWARGGGRPGG